LHDLQRVLELAKHFQVPAYVAINKCDLHAGMVAQIRVAARNAGARVLVEIPYSPLFTESQLCGRPLPEAFPDSAEAPLLRELAARLQEHVLSN